ncbi:MAG TPA: sulfatase-like hydrolase/transferase, partial [Thermoanaerobaculia bacterium]
ADGYAQGFDQLQELDKGWEAYDQLERAGEGRQFVWVHIPDPGVPYLRRGWLLSRLKPGPDGPVPQQLPRRIDAADLVEDFDPSTPVPAERRRVLSAMYRLNVAWADERLGRLLEALRASGQWDRTLLVVTADHGEELGEHQQVLHGGSLSRELLEVPLVIKLPAGAPRIASLPSERVAATRLWATLAEAAGTSVPPAVAPSLFHAVPAPIVSELYLGSGANQLSLVEGDRRLLWENRFAPAGPAVSAAWVEAMDASSAAGPKPLPAALLAAFWSTPPVAARTARLVLERWGERNTEVVADPRQTAEMARRLAAIWGRFDAGSLAPAEEAREWPDLLARRPDL